MKKIMFDNHYGLETAVLNGTKTMTRRVLTVDQHNRIDFKAFYDGEENCALLNQADDIWGSWKRIAPYQVGEVVAIAQSYKDAGYDEDTKVRCKGQWHTIGFTAGWENKMFVRADEMPHQIQITDVKVEHLQDISDEDCLKEGVEKWIDCYIVPGIMENQGKNNVCFDTPREAFHALITKISGKNVWIDNPLVFAYTFKLVK